MAFKKKNVEQEYCKYKELQAGEVIVEGTYEKCPEGKFGIQHHFRTPENTVKVLNSSGHLNFLLNEYAYFGDYCKVTYEGMVLLEKGNMKGKEAHQFSLEIDDDRFDESFSRNNPEHAKKKKMPEKEELNEPNESTPPKCDESLEDMTL